MFLWKAGVLDAAKLVYALAQEDKHCEEMAELLGVRPMSDEPPSDGQQRWNRRTLLECDAQNI